MIQTEHLQDGKLIRHYSDKDMMILQVETGIKYSEAIDVVPCAFTYEETEDVIEVTAEEALWPAEEGADRRSADSVG